MNTVSLYAPNWDSCDSYGRLALETSRHLTALGLYVNEFINQKQTRPIKMSLGGILFGYPTNYPSYGVYANSGKRIAFTMFESSALPDEWIEPLNQCEAVIVPSYFLIDVFKTSGVTVPIHVVPLGVDSDVFTYHQREFAPEVFKFLTIGDRGGRKGWLHVGNAFYRAFGERMDVSLTMKAREGSSVITGVSNPNIAFHFEDMARSALADFFKQFHAMFFLGREGFGWPPREFAATGGRAFVLNWGGTADEITHWGTAIDHYKLVPAWDGDSHLKGTGQWAEPDIDTVAVLMKQSITEHAQWTAQHSLSVSQAIARLYRWQDCAQAIYEIWEHYCGSQQRAIKLDTSVAQ